MKKTNCCESGKKDKGFLSGLIYGLIPHAGCIAFILFTIFGLTTLTALIRPLLLNAYFFYILIGLSFVFATISAMIYLKRNEILSLNGAKKKWKYLSVLYGTTMGVNIILFLFIFPVVANMASGSDENFSGDMVVLKVNIPCPGHAPLITEELKTINGVGFVKFSFPNYFEVRYDPLKTSFEEVIGLDVFSTYSAEIVDGEESIEQVQVGCSTCNTCSGACGGSCGV